MSSNSKHDYFIIRADNDEISKKQRDLEQHMIDDFSYKEENWDSGEKISDSHEKRKKDNLSYRKALHERINYFDYNILGITISTFCAADHYSGMNTYASLTNYLYNTKNTVIYSIENKILDCVLLFREKEDFETGNPYIDIISFCANQMIPSKKGGIFFEHFLNSIRGQYTQIEVSTTRKAFPFYDSFQFENKGIEYDSNLIRKISENEEIKRTKRSSSRTSSRKNSRTSSKKNSRTSSRKNSRTSSRKNSRTSSRNDRFTHASTNKKSKRKGFFHTRKSKWL